MEVLGTRDAEISELRAEVRTAVARMNSAILALFTVHGAIIDGLVSEGDIQLASAIRVTSHLDRSLTDLAAHCPSTADAETLGQIAEVFRSQAADLASRLKTEKQAH